MAVNVLQWLPDIGIFYHCSHSAINIVSQKNYVPKVRSINSYLSYVFCSLILLTQGDIETNPGPEKPHAYFSCCRLNVNSLVSHKM